MGLKSANAWWIVANVVVPIFLPIVVCAFQRTAAHGRQRDRLRPVLLIKDGQLGWIATALCAVGACELYEAGANDVFGVTAAWMMATLGFLGTLFAVNGITNLPPLPLRKCNRQRPLIATMWVTWFAAVGLITIHFRAEYKNFLHQVLIDISGGCATVTRKPFEGRRHEYSAERKRQRGAVEHLHGRAVASHAFVVVPLRDRIRCADRHFCVGRHGHRAESLNAKVPLHRIRWL